MNNKILIVEDEKEIAQLLKVYLENDGFEVVIFHQGLSAIEYIKNNEISVALLDVMLPDLSGFEITRNIREEYFFPIIMLTARVEATDKITGLTFGADDYITKPFNPLEVVARVKTQIRRMNNYNQANVQKNQNVIDIRGLIINNDTHRALLYDQEIELTPIEFNILYYLASHQGEVISSEKLFEVVWQEKFYSANNTVMTHMARLREKLKDSSKNPKFIRTVWGVGYTIDK